MPIVKPTRQEILAEAVGLADDGTLKDEDREDVMDLVTEWSAWDERLRPQLEEAVAAASGYRAMRLLAALAKIDALGQKAVEVRVEGLITRSKASERGDWVGYIAAVLRLRRTVGAGGASARLKDLKLKEMLVL